MEKLLEKINAVVTTATPKAEDLFSGTWQNQLGSTMTLQAAGQHVTGTYHTAVGTPTEQESELVGFVLGDLITFTVHFGKSLASWSGQIQGEGSAGELIAMWHLIVNVDDPMEATGMWQATCTGSDRFSRI